MTISSDENMMIIEIDMDDDGYTKAMVKLIDLLKLITCQGHMTWIKDM